MLDLTETGWSVFLGKNKAAAAGGGCKDCGCEGCWIARGPLAIQLPGLDLDAQPDPGCAPPQPDLLSLPPLVYL